MPAAAKAAVADLPQRSWLSLLPRRLMPAPECRASESRSDWQDTQVRVPGSAWRRRSGMISPQSSRYSALAAEPARALRPVLDVGDLSDGAVARNPRLPSPSSPLK